MAIIKTDSVLSNAANFSKMNWLGIFFVFYSAEF